MTINKHIQSLRLWT